jgi:toxin ParE1/3/4
MPHYKFTEQAERDLEAITDYTLGNWSHRQADIYLDGLEALAQKLADTPGLGTHRDTLIPGLLSFPYVSHILYYLKESHGITVIRVLHQRMAPERHLSSP